MTVSGRELVPRVGCAVSIDIGSATLILTIAGKTSKGIRGRHLKTNRTRVVNSFNYSVVVVTSGSVIGRPEVVVRVTSRRIVIPRSTPSIEVLRILNTIGDGHIVASILVDRTFRKFCFVHAGESIFTTELVKGRNTFLLATIILSDIDNGKLFYSTISNGLFYLYFYRTRSIVGGNFAFRFPTECLCGEVVGFTLIVGYRNWCKCTLRCEP